MSAKFSVDLAERLKSATTAKRALLDQLQPKTAQTDPLHAERDKIRGADLAQVRADRLAERSAKKQAAADKAAERVRDQAAADEAALALKRGARKERKALSSAEAKAKRDAKYAARKARG